MASKIVGPSLKKEQFSAFSPRQSLPLMENSQQPIVADAKAGSTYYLTKNKSQKQAHQFVPHQFSTKTATGQAFVPDSSVMSGSYMTSPQTGQQPARKTIGTRGSNKTYFEERTTFKKRHVSQKVEDRNHSTQVKNMNLIQRQLAANTNYAKNRLAFDRSRLAPTNSLLSQGQSFRSHTVASNRQGSQSGVNGGLLNLGKKQKTAESTEAELSATMPNLGSIVRIQVQTADMNKRQRVGATNNASGMNMVEPHAQTWSSSFEPLGLPTNNVTVTATAAQALYKTQNPFMSGDKVPTRVGKSKRDFKTPDGRKQTIYTTNHMRILSQTQSSFDGRANTALDNKMSLRGNMDKEITNLKVVVGQRGGGATSRFGVDQRSPSAFAGRTKIELLDSKIGILGAEGPNEMFVSDRQLTLEKNPSNAKGKADHEGFLDSHIKPRLDLFGSQTISPANSKPAQQPIFTAAELDVKRIVNNITEVQPSKLTEENPSHQIAQLQMSSHLTMEPSYLPTQNSAILSSSNAGRVETQFTAITSGTATSTHLSGGAALGSCQKCRMWKRINQAVRNIANRTNLQDMPGALSALKEVVDIDSIQKTVPNLTKLLQSLQENLQSQFSQQVGKYESEVVKLRAKLQKLDEDNKAFKAQHDQLSSEYKEVKDFIFGSRFNSVQGEKDWEKFLEEDAQLKERVLENKKKQHELCYSGLFSVMTDQEHHVKTQGEMLERTIDYLREKILQNKNNSIFHHHLDEIFLREQYLQRQAARDFMSSHFRYGMDPPVQTFERGTVTSRNMISEKYGYMSKAEKFQRVLEARQRETITQVKMENSLLMQQNTELQQEVDDLSAYLDALEVKVQFFKEYDIAEVKKATKEYGKLAQEQQITQLRYTESEEQRRKLHIELKELKKERDLFVKFLGDQLDFHLKMFEEFKFVRSEIQHPENEEDIHRLDLAQANLTTKTNEFTSKRQTTALLKRLGEDQRKHLLACSEYLKSCIANALAKNKPLMCTSQMTNTLMEQIRAQLTKEFQEAKNEDAATIAELKAKIEDQEEEWNEKETEMQEKFAKDLKEANELAKKNANQVELKHQQTIKEMQKQQMMVAKAEKPAAPAKAEKKNVVKPPAERKSSKKTAGLLTQVTKRVSGPKKQTTRRMSQSPHVDETSKTLETEDVESEQLSEVQSMQEDERDGYTGDAPKAPPSEARSKQKQQSNVSRVPENSEELNKLQGGLSSMDRDKARIGKHEVNLVLEEHPESRQNSSQQQASLKVLSLHESSEKLEQLQPVMVNNNVLTQTQQKPSQPLRQSQQSLLPQVPLHSFTFSASKQMYPTLDQIQAAHDTHPPRIAQDYMRRENTSIEERIQAKSVAQLYPGDVRMKIAYFDPKHRIPTPPKNAFTKKSSAVNPTTQPMQHQQQQNVFSPLAKETKERRIARNLIDNSKEIQCNIISHIERNVVMKFNKMVQTDQSLDFKIAPIGRVGRYCGQRSSTVPRNLIDHLSHSKEKQSVAERDGSQSYSREPSIYNNTKGDRKPVSDDESEVSDEKCAVKVIPDDIMRRTQASLNRHQTGLLRSPVKHLQPKMYKMETLSVTPADLNNFSYTPRKQVTAQALSKLLQENTKIPADSDYVQESVMLEIKSIQSPPNTKQKQIQVELEDTHRIETDSDMLEKMEQAAKYNSYLHSANKSAKKKKQPRH